MSDVHSRQCNQGLEILAIHRKAWKSENGCVDINAAFDVLICRKNVAARCVIYISVAVMKSSTKGNLQKELEDSIKAREACSRQPSRKQRAHWKWGKVINPKSVIPTMQFLQQGATSQRFFNFLQTAPPTGDPVFKHMSLWGTFSFKPQYKGRQGENGNFPCGNANEMSEEEQRNKNLRAVRRLEKGQCRTETLGERTDT